MSERKDQRAEPSAESTDVEKRSGRASFDERGNSVWEWRTDSGDFSRDVETQRVRKLELGELSLAETAIQRRPEGLTPHGKVKEGANPYNNAKTPGGGFNPYDTGSQRAMKRESAAPSPKVARTPAELRKLDEFLKMKRRLEQQKQEEDE